MFLSSCNSLSYCFHLVFKSKGLDSSQLSLRRQRSCIIVLATNVTGPSNPRGSKIKAIRDRMVLLVEVSSGGKQAIVENLNESVSSHMMPKVRFQSPCQLTK